MEQSRKNVRIMILLFVGVLMGALDLSIVGPVIPAIEKTMRLSEIDIGRIFSIYMLFYLFGLFLMPKLSDKRGRRLIYIMSVTIFGIGSCLTFLSANFTLLLAGRAIQGFGSSGIFPVAAATIGDVFPVEKRGRALGILGSVYGIAFILGPFIAGSMLLYFDWNAIFLINLPLSLLLIIFSLKLLPGRNRLMKPINSRAGFSLQLFRSLQLRLVAVIAFGLGLFQSCIVFIPKLSVELFGVSPSKASFMLLPLLVAIAIVPPVSGRLLDMIGSRIIIVSGLIFAAFALFILALFPGNLPLFYAAEAALGFGLAIRASLKYIVLKEALPADRGTAQGMLIIFISFGQLVGAALTGTIASGFPGKPEGFGYAFLLLAAVAASLVILSVFLRNRKSEFEN